MDLKGGERRTTSDETKRTACGCSRYGGGAVAGCTSNTDDGDGGSVSGNGASGPYSVTMEPVGIVEFESVSVSWFPFTGDYADMGVALGQADGVEAIDIRARYGTHVYDELPDVSVEESELTELWTGSNDALVPVAGPTNYHEQLREHGYRNELSVFPGYNHFVFALWDQ